LPKSEKEFPNLAQRPSSQRSFGETEDELSMEEDATPAVAPTPPVVAYFDALFDRQKKSWNKVARNASSILKPRPLPPKQEKITEGSSETNAIIIDDIEEVDLRLNNLEAEIILLKERRSILQEKNEKIQQAKRILEESGLLEDTDVWLKAIVQSKQEREKLQQSFASNPPEIMWPAHVNE
jgi:hypothetical protein